MDYMVILFHSTQSAIWTGKVLKKSGFEHKMIPVPRRLSSDCGYCVRIKKEDREGVEALMKSTGIDYQHIEAL